MPTASGHTTAIRATRVTGADVYNMSGDKIGEVEDVVLEKTSNRIMFAIVSFGGFLGFGEKYHPVPWAMLDYEDDRSGYVVNLTKEKLEAAPANSISELVKDDGTNARTAAYDYYKVDREW